MEYLIPLGEADRCPLTPADLLRQPHLAGVVGVGHSKPREINATGGAMTEPTRDASLPKGVALLRTERSMIPPVGHPRRPSTSSASGKPARSFVNLGGSGVVNLPEPAAVPVVSAAAASPARVRSMMVSRSSWAKGRHDGKHGFPHGAGGVDCLREGSEADAAGFEFFDHFEDVAGVAAEPVQLPYRQRVSSPQVVQYRGQLGPLGLGSAYALVAEYALGASGVQCIELQIQVLLRSADSCVFNDCHVPNAPSLIMPFHPLL